jgi:ABC-type phosphate/phosphonate transport system substrate-binding protein
MYDRPEIRAETDALWAAMREAIRDAGLDAPERLERARSFKLVWAAPELVLAQTCGLPYVSALHHRVGLIGAPAHSIEGCPPGHYRSALVVGQQTRAGDIAALFGCRAAINARDSQSGYAALMEAAAPHAREGRFFGDVVLTGSHAASIAAVASGRADIAAIDAVTWALALRHDRTAQAVRLLGWTEPTPTLPYITARRRDVAAIAGAVASAIAALPAGVRDALLIAGFVRFDPGDYDVIRARLAAAHTAHRLPVQPY